MGFLDDLSLLGRHAPEDARNLLKTILGGMPITQIAQGEADVSPNKLAEALRATPVFDKGDTTGLQEGMNWMTPMLAAKIVYHGSPHKFDKFDASKIGTGEGAQAYGHGVYLADAPEVAKGYRDALAIPEVQMGGSTFEPKDNIYKLATHAQQNGLKTRDDVVSFWQDRVNESKAALKAQKAGTADWRQNSSAEMLARRQEMLALAKKTDPSQISINEGGALYKADLPDEWIPKMLDWDNAIPETTRQQISKPMMEKFGSGASGGQGLNQWKAVVWEFKNAGSKQPEIDAAKFLQENGIPGIRYLDGGSRGKGQGSYNYVVFPGLEDKVKILERNGQPINVLAEILK